MEKLEARVARMATDRPSPIGPTRLNGPTGFTGPATNEELTPREYEILALLAMGYSNHQIALAASIAGSTVEQHLVHIYRKLDVTSRVQAARCAWDYGITLQRLSKK